jgi:hypothetical protein
MLGRRRPRLTVDQVLGSRPIRNPAVQVERIEGGGLKAKIGRRRDWWIRALSAFLPIPRERLIELDAAGEQVWDLCDGEHTLKEMIRIFQEQHKLIRVEAEWSLRTYLKDLGKRGLVGFVVDKLPAGKGATPQR